MGAVKEALAVREEKCADICKRLINSLNRRDFTNKEELRLANFTVTAKDLLGYALEFFWRIDTDGDDYVIEADYPEMLFYINYMDKTMRWEPIEGGGGTSTGF